MLNGLLFSGGLLNSDPTSTLTTFEVDTSFLPRCLNKDFSQAVLQSGIFILYHYPTSTSSKVHPHAVPSSVNLLEAKSTLFEAKTHPRRTSSPSDQPRTTSFYL
ncbi:hypothetical protein PIB30_092369 [Stylosanthes scabra]|uniref:Uncharacterized protein n=1 Tax=Stylosanthes scabra TaxID=79078 RepID=A0ABU6TX59_9FABA|nr:hypothetical protein [Stylosanthes scabra]